MAINLNFAGASLRKPGAGYILPEFTRSLKIMDKKLKQLKNVKGSFSCLHPRIKKEFFMKDENRPLYHCEVCFVELFETEEEDIPVISSNTPPSNSGSDLK